jgi:hypothetical protein
MIALLVGTDATGAQSLHQPRKIDRLSKMSGMLLNLLGINEDTLALPGCFLIKEFVMRAFVLRRCWRVSRRSSCCLSSSKHRQHDIHRHPLNFFFMRLDDSTDAVFSSNALPIG